MSTDSPQIQRTLLDLDDNSLLTIFKFLAIEDYIKLVHTCERLRMIVKETYRTAKPLYFPFKRLLKNDNDKIQILKCFDCISTNLQKLVLSNIDWADIANFKSIIFPKLKKLVIYPQPETYTDIADEYFCKLISNNSLSVEELVLIEISWKHVDMLRKIFLPKVNKLKLSYFQDNYYKVKLSEIIKNNFPLLKNVTLIKDQSTELRWSTHGMRFSTEIDRSSSFCAPLDFEVSQKRFFETLALNRTLEIIEMDYHHLYISVNYIPKFTNLKCLTLTTDECLDVGILQRIMQHFKDFTSTIICNNKCGIYDSWNTLFSALKNIKCVIFNECNFFVYRDGCNPFVYKPIKMLREFRFRKNRNYINEEEMLFNVLSTSKCLEIFDISYSNCDISFLKKAIYIVNKNRKMDPRKDMLKIYCGNTKITPEQLKEISLPSFIQISLKSEQIRMPQYPVNIRFEIRN